MARRTLTSSGRSHHSTSVGSSDLSVTSVVDWWSPVTESSWVSWLTADWWRPPTSSLSSDELDVIRWDQSGSSLGRCQRIRASINAHSINCFCGYRFVALTTRFYRQCPCLIAVNLQHCTVNTVVMLKCRVAKLKTNKLMMMMMMMMMTWFGTNLQVQSFCKFCISFSVYYYLYCISTVLYVCFS